MLLPPGRDLGDVFLTRLFLPLHSSLFQKQSRGRAYTLFMSWKCAVDDVCTGKPPLQKAHPIQTNKARFSCSSLLAI